MHRRRPSLTMTLALVCLAVLLVLLLWAFREPWLPARWLVLARGSGLCAALLLCAALSITPLSRVARACGSSLSLAHAAGARRTLGLFAASLGLVHAALSWFLVLPPEPLPLVTVPHLRAGVVAQVILVALLLTSFPRLVAALGLRVWKELHVLAYVAGALVLQHVLLSPFAPRATALALVFALLLLGLARLLPRR